MSQNSERQFYENVSYWDPERYESLESERTMETWRWVPSETQCLLDLGCGNGIFCNYAPPHISTYALDRAFAPLRWVKKPVLQADAVSLPFADQQFDTVVSLEVIEHLPHKIFPIVIDEIARVAKKAILISVPYQENRKNAQVRCPHCLCQFHLHYHMRSFDHRSLANLFTLEMHGFYLVKTQGISKMSQRLFGSGARWVKQLTPRFSFPPHAVCPQCGFSGNELMSGTSLTAAPKKLGWLKMLINSVWPKRIAPKWWLAMYHRTS
jgi:SAM-dependent methyltransferase